MASQYINKKIYWWFRYVTIKENKLVKTDTIQRMVKFYYQTLQLGKNNFNTKTI